MLSTDSFTTSKPTMALPSGVFQSFCSVNWVCAVSKRDVDSSSKEVERSSLRESLSCVRAWGDHWRSRPQPSTRVTTSECTSKSPGPRSNPELPLAWVNCASVVQPGASFQRIEAEPVSWSNLSLSGLWPPKDTSGLVAEKPVSRTVPALSE